MSYISRRTKHVVAVVEEIKDKVLQEIDQSPEEMCTAETLAEIVANSYKTVAEKHGVSVTTIQDACTRGSDIDCIEDFYTMLLDAIGGGDLLEKQLAATAKNNESPAEIATAFARIL